MEQKFKQIQTYLDKGQIPPVEKWNPDYCGDSQMRILRNGTWLHHGTPIGRENLVKLFASVLKREGDDYFLVTPVEKLGITVDIAPFVMVDFEVKNGEQGQLICFKTNLGERVTLNLEHPLTIETVNGEEVPLVMVRRNLPAVINSSTFVALSELAQSDPANPDAMWVESCGVRFSLV